MSLKKDDYRPVRSLSWLLAGIIVLIIVCDQILKIWVKTHFYLGEDYEILPWFQIKFIQNNGMAFGMELTSKILLTLCRILAVVIFIWGLGKILRFKDVRVGFLIAMSLIIAGAAGNVFDCVFYGEIFNNPPPPQVAQIFPRGGGYADWFNGQVVDMLYFPFFSFEIGGREYEFFQYIFNLADSSICVGVFMLILFYSRDLGNAWRHISLKKDVKNQ